MLSLFIAAMLTLVLADNFLLLYIAWEGVGICSFLLIGHYCERRSAAEAAKKAFITTRFGDVFLLIGIILLWREAGTFDMSEIFHMAEEGEIRPTYLTRGDAVPVRRRHGQVRPVPVPRLAAGRHGGPDAGLRPDPRRDDGRGRRLPRGAHACRCSRLVRRRADFVIVIGMITTFMSVFMGLVMTDIKRVVAYSTLNSLGLMMVALGFGEHGVGAAMLYLFAHAFFKALLFLGCGSVIHATEQPGGRRAGRLWRKMPITSTTFLIGALAMAGCRAAGRLLRQGRDPASPR